MTPDERATLRAEHQPLPEDPTECQNYECDERWPCNVTRLLDALDEADGRRVDLNMRLVASAAKAVKEGVETGRDPDHLFEHWSLVMAECTSRDWAAHGEVLRAEANDLLARLLKDPSDGEAVWRLAHHPAARPPSTPQTTDSSATTPTGDR